MDWSLFGLSWNSCSGCTGGGGERDGTGTFDAQATVRRTQTPRGAVQDPGHSRQQALRIAKDTTTASGSDPDRCNAVRHHEPAHPGKTRRHAPCASGGASAKGNGMSRTPAAPIAVENHCKTGVSDPFRRTPKVRGYPISRRIRCAQGISVTRRHFTAHGTPPRVTRSNVTHVAGRYAAGLPRASPNAAGGCPWQAPRHDRRRGHRLRMATPGGHGGRGPRARPDAPERHRPGSPVHHHGAHDRAISDTTSAIPLQRRHSNPTTSLPRHPDLLRIRTGCIRVCCGRAHRARCRITPIRPLKNRPSGRLQQDASRPTASVQ